MTFDPTKPIGDDFEIPLVPERLYTASITYAKIAEYTNDDGSVNIVLQLGVAFETPDGKRETETKYITIIDGSNRLSTSQLRRNVDELKKLMNFAGMTSENSYDDLVSTLPEMPITIEVKHYVSKKDGMARQALNLLFD